jgi:ABC-type lipoprotein release transport system permease subunit
MLLMTRIAFLNLWRHRGRSLLLGGAIALVSALLALLTCLSAGVRASVLASSTAISTGQINVAGYYKVTPGRTLPLLVDRARLQALVAATLPDLDYQVARGRAWVKLAGPQGVQQVSVHGVDIANEPALPRVLDLAEGSFQGLTRPGTVVIFASLARKMGLRLGDSVTLAGPTVREVANAVDLRVVGLAQDIGPLNRFNVFIPSASLDALYRSQPGSTGALQVYLKDIGRAPQDLALLRDALTRAGYGVLDHEPGLYFQKLGELDHQDWTGQRLDLTLWEDEIGPMRWTLSALDAVTWILVSVLLAVISIGLMNVLWIAIRERTREIGTLRAIGMQRSSVAQLFVSEALWLGLAGTVAGTLLGCAAAAGLNALRLPVPAGARIILMSTVLRLAYEPMRLALSAAAIVTATTLVALIPATLAARLPPVTAMNRHD